MYTILRLSARATSFAPSEISMASAVFVTGTDSPVSAASSTFIEASSMMRPSAGMLSPASSTTTSPGTSPALSMVTICPSRSTFDFAAVISLRAAMASSALFSWITPSTELRTTTNNIMKTSDGFSCWYSDVMSDRAAAARRMRIIGSFIWSKNLAMLLLFFASISLFGPYLVSLADASAACRPFSEESAFESTSSVLSRYGLYPSSIFSFPSVHMVKNMPCGMPFCDRWDQVRASYSDAPASSRR